MTAIFRFLFLTLLFFSAACKTNSGKSNPASSEAGWFIDITKQSKINFVHDPGVDGSYFMPESMGSGGGFLDYDNDGDLDVYLINSGPHSPGKPGSANQLFRQEADHTFTDVTAQSGAGDTGYGMGVAAGDIENDGDIDLYVTNFGSDALYRNNGNGTFTNITKEAGITNATWGTSVIFSDYDRDGYLDIYVANYVQFDPKITCTDRAGRQDYCGPDGYRGIPDVLYRNNGNGTFTDRSLESGIGRVDGKGLGVVSADFNNDLFTDFYVANDGEPNFLWINQKDGTFKDEALQLGAAVNVLGQPEASMGIAVADIDEDADWDLYMTHLRGETNTFYRNNGNAGFQDDSAASGLGNPALTFTGFGTGFFDYDQDGDLDAFMVNGRVTRGPLLTQTSKPSYWDDYAEPDVLLENPGSNRFENVSSKAGVLCSLVENGRGLAFGDIDNDGDIDLLVTNEGGSARLFRNDVPNKGNWIIIRVIDPSLKRDAIGARVMIESGGKKYYRLETNGYSYLSTNDPRVHFGLGKQDRVDSVTVLWPDGSEEVFDGSPANKLITVKKGDGRGAK